MQNNSFNIVVPTKDSIHALSFANSIVEKRNIKPILGNVKLEVVDSKLNLTATSLDITISLSIGAEVQNNGATTVNILTFVEIIRKLNDNFITLNFKQGTEQLEIVGTNFTSELSTLPVQDFPILDHVTSINKFRVPAKNLLRIFTHTEFAMCTEEARYSLNGIFLNSKVANLLNATAIDGHRLATASENIANIKEFGVLLPRKTVFELIKILKDTHYNGFEVQVEHDNNRICFSINNLSITSKLIDGQFPDYNSLIPDLSLNKLTTSSKFLAEVVARVATITHDKFKVIKFVVSQSAIEISASGEAKGSANEVIRNTEENQKFIYEGDDITIGFNPRYLLDILNTLDEQEIDIHLVNSLNPLLINPINNSKDRYVIMPIKV